METPREKLERLAALSHDELVARVMAAESGAKSTVNGLKVSAKGGVSLYGVGKFPVTLYTSQWGKIIELVQTGVIQKFIEDNRDSLAVKPAKDEA